MFCWSSLDLAPLSPIPSYVILRLFILYVTSLEKQQREDCSSCVWFISVTFPRSSSTDQQASTPRPGSLENPRGVRSTEEPSPLLTSSLHPQSSAALIPPFEFLSGMKGDWRRSSNRARGLLSIFPGRYMKIERGRLTEVGLGWPGLPGGSTALNAHSGKGSKRTHLVNLKIGPRAWS